MARERMPRSSGLHRTIAASDFPARAGNTVRDELGTGCICPARVRRPSGRDHNEGSRQSLLETVHHC